MKKELDLVRIGGLLQELREDKQLTQEDVAQMLHVVRATVSLYETGNALIPADSLLFLANLYNVNVDYILGNTKVRSSWADLTTDLELESGSITEITELISNIRKLSEHDRTIAIELIHGLLSKSEKSAENK